MGGHLVASALGGYGRRANLIPQNGQMNNGVWRIVENKVGRCARSPFRTVYQATPGYANSLSLRPSRLYASLWLTRRIIGLIPYPVVGGTLGLANEVEGGNNGRANTLGFTANFVPYCG